MSRSGSSAQFGAYLPQESLGPDFDRYHAQMRDAGFDRSYQQERGAASGTTVAISTAPRNVSKITGTGEIRNGFAPGATLLHPHRAYMDNRLRTEEHVFGIPQDADHTQRPVYGYLDHTTNREPGPYGDAVFDVHPHPYRSVTTSPNDSLDGFLEAQGEYDDDERAGQMVDVEELDTSHEPWPNRSRMDYQEVQVHGGPIDLRREVTKAHLFRSQHNTKQIDQAADELKMARVPHKVYTEMEYQPTLDRDMFGAGKQGWVDEQAHLRSR